MSTTHANKGTGDPAPAPAQPLAANAIDPSAPSKPGLEITTVETFDPYDEEAKKPLEDSVRQSAFANISKKQALKLFWRSVAFCAVGLFGVMMDGFQLGLPGSIVANRGFINQFGTVINARTGLLALDPAYLSYWSLSQFSCAFGIQFVNGIISDKYGRRTVLWGMTVILVIGLFIEMFAKTWWQWLLGKICMGIGQGMCQHGVLTYLGEMAPTAIRGSVIASYAWGWCFGQLFAACTLYAVNSLSPLNYLNAIYAEWIPLGLWILLLPLLPESPWFYARKGLHDKAKKTMARIYKGVEGYDVEYEYLVMQDRIAEESEKNVANKQVRWRDIVKGTDLRRTIAGIFCVNQQALSGMNVIMGQTTYFFQQIGLPEPFQANVIVYCMSMIGIVGSLYTIERFGRRKLIITSTLILISLNVCVASLDFVPDSSAVQQATLALICLWVFTYACGLSSTCWAAPAECPTLRLRAKTMSAILMTNSLSNVLYSSTIPLMISSDGRSGAVGWGRRTLFLFVCLGAIGLTGNYFFLPETKGRSYHELDEMYEAGIPPRKMAQYHTEIERSGKKKHL